MTLREKQRLGAAGKAAEAKLAAAERERRAEAFRENDLASLAQRAVRERDAALFRAQGEREERDAAGSCPACGARAFATSHADGCRLAAFRLQKGDRFEDTLLGRLLVVSVARDNCYAIGRIRAGGEPWSAWFRKAIERLRVKAQDAAGHQVELWFYGGDIAWPVGECLKPPAVEERQTWAEWRRG